MIFCWCPGCGTESVLPEGMVGMFTVFHGCHQPGVPLFVLLPVYHAQVAAVWAEVEEVLPGTVRR